MSQTSQQDASHALPKAGKHWELFWRIIAGLMLVVIAWVVWVLYQITPRSVVTPMAYESSAKPIGAQPAPSGATMPAISPISAVQPGVIMQPQRTAEAAAAELAMEQAQASARAGAHQPSADVQAEALEKGREKVREEEQLKSEGLKLSTEISTPMAEKKSVPATAGGKPGGN
ncbi:MAG: hypothetical protein NT123_12965 [Proteobacteria bacterium]|nr:hypothetical protein [Pseudomonadota bacterium]